MATATNNLKGSITKDNNVIYSKEIREGMFIKVIALYEPYYTKNNNTISTRMEILSTVTDGRKYTYSNGVTVLEDYSSYYVQEKGKKIKDLETIDVEEGIKVREVLYNVTDFLSDEGKEMMFVITKRVAEIEKEKLLNIIKCNH